MAARVDPAVLLSDEPTGNSDPESAREVVQPAREAARGGARGRNQGSLRDDATAQDSLVIASLSPDLWQRYLLNGLWTERAVPTLLPVPSLTAEQLDDLRGDRGCANRWCRS